MEVRAVWDMHNDSKQLVSSMRSIKLALDGSQISEEKLSRIRLEIYGWIEELGNKSKLDGIDLEIGSTGIVIQVSHSQAARGRVLDAMVHVQEGSIDSFIFITQSRELAVMRNRVKNPQSDKTGHRVYYEEISARLGIIANSFFSEPCGVIGVEIR